MTALQPTLAAAAVALCAGLGVALVVRGLAGRVRSGSSSAWASLALLPWVAVALALVAILTPSVFGADCHCPGHGDGHPHLCWLHPQFAAPLLVPAIIALGVWVAARGPALFDATLAVVRSVRFARALRGATAREIDGVTVRVLACGEPTAFTAGLLTPSIVVDRELVEQLDARSLSAVVQHELAHATRRDGLTLALLRLALAGLPGGARVLERWAAAAEAECDRHAARKLGSAADVASALVAVARLRSRRGATTAAHEVPAIASVRVADRVRALLAAPPRAASLASDTTSVALVTLGIAALVAAWPGDAVHHVAETALGLLVHL